MSGQASGWVLRHGPRPEMLDRNGAKYGQRARGFRSVMAVIADAANRDGENSHPGLAAMIEGSLYSRRQVQNIEDELVSERWIEITEEGGGRGHATVYRLCMERVQPLPLDEDRNGATSDDKGCNADAETVQPDDPAPLPSNVENNETINASAKADARLPAIVASSDHLEAARELCALLATLLEARGYKGCAAKATSKRWIVDMEAMLRIDERAAAQVRAGIEWLDRGGTEASDFWRGNILSPAKLREHWQTLVDRSIAENVKKEPKPRRNEFKPDDEAGVAAVLAKHGPRAATDPPPQQQRALPSAQPRLIDVTEPRESTA